AGAAREQPDGCGEASRPPAAGRRIRARGTRLRGVRADQRADRLPGGPAGAPLRRPAAGGAARLWRGRAHRSQRALPGRRAHPREALPASRGRTALREHRARRAVRGAAAAAPGERRGPRRARQPEGDRARQGRRADQADRQRGAGRPRTPGGHPGVPRDLREGALGLGGYRTEPAGLRLRVRQAVAGAGTVGQRVGEEPAFLLHMVPYRETSLVVDLFSRGHGRIAAIAKGAKRPRSALRAVLLQFQPLMVGWSGRNELRTLTGAEWRGGLTSPSGQALLSAFYMNELLIRLLPREEPHPALFDGYEAALAALSAGASIDETLRRFEWLLL